MKKELQTLFVAIYQGNLSRAKSVLPKLSREDINYQLTADDVTSLKAAMGVALENTEQCGIETGMTPLLVALSKERLSITREMLTRDDINPSITNDIGVSALHMLIMVAHGDERYDKKGEDRYDFMDKLKKPKPSFFGGVVRTLFSSSVCIEEDNDEYDEKAVDELGRSLKDIAILLINKGCPVANPVVSGSLRNLFAEAYFHGQLDIADALAEAKAPLPSTSDHLSYIRNCYSKGLSTVEDRFKISCGRLQRVYDCLASGSAAKLELTNAATIKSLLTNLAIDAATNELRGDVEDADVIELIAKHFEIAEWSGLPIKPQAFEGFLSGLGPER